MSEPAHSKWSASSFERRMLCPGSAVLEADRKDTTSFYAAWGTRMHELVALGIEAGEHALLPHRSESVMIDGFEIEYDPEMHEAVASCLAVARALIGTDGASFTEQRVYYGEYLGQPDEEAFGTGDLIVLRQREITVCDWKGGQGVLVEAEDNPQLKLYALGALAKFGDFGDFDTVRLVIHQPRIREAPAEWTMSVADLVWWGRNEAREVVENCIAAGQALDIAPYLAPGEKQCKFCDAKAFCPKLREEVAFIVGAGATPMTVEEWDAVEPIEVTDKTTDEYLSASMAKVDLIETWATAIRAEVERRLLAGHPVPGFKLVQGRKGARKWVDEGAAEAALKSMRLKIEEMYDMKVISPTTAEKLAKKGVIGKRQWPRLEALYAQSEGKASVAPVSDSRPALDVKPVVEEFDIVPEAPGADDDLSDLA